MNRVEKSTAGRAPKGLPKRAHARRDQADVPYQAIVVGGLVGVTPATYMALI